MPGAPGRIAGSPIDLRARSAAGYSPDPGLNRKLVMEIEPISL